MGHRTVPAPSCPEWHIDSQIHARESRETSQGTTRVFRCRYVDAEDSETYYHYFTVLTGPKRQPRELIDASVPVPPCPDKKHGDRTVWPCGTYSTLAGERQRYQCLDPDDQENTRHTFSALLPRSAVEEDTCCEDCRVLTPKNAGAEAPTRRTNYPASTIYSVLRDLADGSAYTHASMRALKQMGRPTGRSRRVGEQSAANLTKAGNFSPDREQKAHWHIAADILERYGPTITEPMFEAMTAEEDKDREAGLPVVYFADEVPVKRDFARSSSLNSSPVVWTALVVTRTQWEKDPETNKVVGRSSKLVRVRALPNATTEAWTLVLSELKAPGFLIADGAAAIEKAAKNVWGNATTVVPCMYHALTNITKKLTPSKGQLPEKVRDHMYGLTRDDMKAFGPKAVTDWFDQLEVLAEHQDIPLDAVVTQRRQYEPLLCRTAGVAKAGNDPEVQVSNAAVEAQILLWVKKMTRRRGAMMSNLPRTNLLGDLMVAGANGALLSQHQVTQAIRAASTATKGWAPPPRALTGPAGVLGLRDAFSITELLDRGTP